MLALLCNEVDLLRKLTDWMDRFEVESPLEGARHFVHTAVANIGRRYDVEAGLAEEYPSVALKFRDHHELFGENAYEHVLDFWWTACDFLESHDLPQTHADMKRSWHERPRCRPFGQEQGVVPRVFDLIFSGT